MNIEFRISNLRLAPKCGSFLLCRTILNLCASVCIGSLLTLTPVALAQDLPSLDDLLDLDVPENQNKPIFIDIYSLAERLYLVFTNKFFRISNINNIIPHKMK